MMMMMLMTKQSMAASSHLYKDANGAQPRALLLCYNYYYCYSTLQQPSSQSPSSSPEKA